MSGNDFVPAGQCTGKPRRARATVELPRQEMPNFLASINQTAQISLSTVVALFVYLNTDLATH